MSELSKVRCPHCAPFVAKWGEHCHRVYDRPGGALCEQCGGVQVGGQWQYVCQTCKRELEPGGLRGLFVPHLCADCDAKETEHDRKRGAICRRCHETYNHCCC
jgi:DNA-directed RNA polymerase subunit RPC12/RpoP